MFRRVAWLAALAIVVAAAVPAAPAVAAPEAGPPPGYEHSLLAKAAPDECFAGVGLPYPAGPPCAEGQAKVNQGYIWGMTRAQRKLWFGTGANVNCLTSGRNLGPTEPHLNEDWVCEYGQSQIAKANPSLPFSLGDHRSPRLYTYDLSRKALTEKTDEVKNASEDDKTRLTKTAGIRAAGNHQGVVFLGGPALGESINLFAFDGDTGAFLGSVNLPQYGNIRHFVVADGVLYAGVGVGANGGNRGHVLRWTGSKADPFSFVEVARLPAQAADLTVHDGRVFVTTWIGADDSLAATTAVDPPVPGIASVWMSPKLSDGERGLDTTDAERWTRVWSASEYEPDPLVARTYALGGLASYGGYLYWGTMHVPLKATKIHITQYPPVDETAAKSAFQNTQRAIAIFRGKNFGGETEKVDLLYGAPELPVYDPAGNGGAGSWAAGSTGYTPVYGASGFGNRFLNYTWKMVVAGGRLYVGTMDWSYISQDLQEDTAESLNLSASVADDPPAPPPPTYGADVYVFDSHSKAARAIDTSGMGNYLNYGVRNMVADGTNVYLGMANPMNLRADPNDDVPEGGWELIKLSPERC
jgi:hypothetical protein